MEAAAAIGASTSLFRVPPVLGVDEAGLTVTVGFIESFVPLGERSLSATEDESLFVDLGRAIRGIHDGVWIDEQGHERALFHGDLDPYNIGLDLDGRLVFLDWDQAPGLEGAKLEPQEADLGLIQFYLAAHFIRKLKTPSVAEESLRRVVQGYCEGVGGMRPEDVQPLGVRVGESLTRLETVPGRGPRRALRWGLRWGALRLLDSFDPW